MFDQLQKLEDRYNELEKLLADYEAIKDKEQYNKYAKELSDLRQPVSLFRQYKKISEEIKGLEKVIAESREKELCELAREDINRLRQENQELEKMLEASLKGEDEDLGRDVIVEVRPGTGGQEASLFAGDLYRMYTKYAARKNWTLEPMYIQATEVGGFKEVVFSIKGKDAYRRLRFESGVHRVQRVPTTESQGRIHTSTATVVVLAEPEERDFVIEPKDLRIDTYRSSGPGGQHMQKSDSAVRITHLTSGVVVACQDERSQLKNKTKAMRILRARLLDIREQEELKKRSRQRKAQIGTGDRSEKIRTYNFPDRRVTDHRINFTSHQLEAILEGDLDEISDALIKAAEQNS